jgi:hypothetical protein
MTGFTCAAEVIEIKKYTDLLAINSNRFLASFYEVLP